MPRIDPDNFSRGQWVEAFYASELLPTDDYDDAEPFEASIEHVEQAAQCCRAKAERVRSGGLGETVEVDVDIDDWADELDEAAAVLEGYLGGK